MDQIPDHSQIELKVAVESKLSRYAYISLTLQAIKSKFLGHTDWHKQISFIVAIPELREYGYTKTGFSNWTYHNFTLGVIRFTILLTNVVYKEQDDES
jgi:uncharacterized membrane protein